MDILKTVTGGAISLGAFMAVMPHLGPELVEGDSARLRANPDHILGKVVNALAEHNIPLLSGDRNTRVQQLATMLEPGNLVLSGIVAGAAAKVILDHTVEQNTSPKHKETQNPAKQLVRNIGEFAAVGAALIGAMLCVPVADKHLLQNTITRDGEGAVTGVSGDTLLGKAVHLLARHVGGGTPEENALKIGGMVKPEHLVGAALMGTGAVVAGARSFAGRVSHDRSSAGGAERL